MSEIETVAPPPDAAARRPRRFRALRAILLPVFVAALGWFVWTQRAALAEAAQAPPRDLALIALLFAVAHFLNSVEFTLLFRAMGARMGVLENWMLFTAGQLANHLPGQIGSIYRWRYMKSVHGVGYSGSLAVYGANLVITFAGAAAAGLVGVAGSALTGGARSLLMALIFGAMAVGAVVAAGMRIPALSARYRGGSFERHVDELREGAERLRAEPGMALGVCLLEAIKYVVTAWRLQVTFGLIGIAQPFWVFLVLAPAAGVASFIGFTPAALGFREAFVTAGGVAMGITLTGGLLGATVDRAVMLATFLVLGGIGLAYTWPRLRRAEAAGGATPVAAGRVHG